VATEFVGGSITAPGLGEGGGGVLPGANPYDPQTPESIIDLLRATNPWAADADFDHHGYGLVTAGRRGLKCTLRRVDTVKRRSRMALPDERFSYRIGRGEPSLLD
jgi:alkaline phosphatase D